MQGWKGGQRIRPRAKGGGSFGPNAKKPTLWAKREGGARESRPHAPPPRSATDPESHRPRPTPPICNCIKELVSLSSLTVCCWPTYLGLCRPISIQ